MTRTTLVLLALLSVGLAQDTSKRLDDLIARWRKGDEAARAGVVAEAKTLGDKTLAELFRRVTKPVAFAPPSLGIAAPKHTPGSKTGLVNLTIRLATVEGPDGAIVTRTGVVSAEDALILRGKLKFIVAPKLTVYDGQRANVTVADQRQYTRAFDAEKAPVMGTIQTGMVLDVVPVIGKDKKSIELQLRCEQTRLLGLDKVDTAAGAIEAPRVAKRQTALTLTLQTDGRVLVALPGGGEQPLVVDVQARVLEFVPGFLEEAGVERKKKQK